MTTRLESRQARIRIRYPLEYTAIATATPAVTNMLIVAAIACHQSVSLMLSATITDTRSGTSLAHRSR